MGRGSVKRVVDQYGVYLDERCLGTFWSLLDAHCFALQLLERGMVDSVRLYSGTTVT